MSYQDFLKNKAQSGRFNGFDPVFLPDFLFDFQAELVDWAVRKGKAAIFADCGLGKTPMQLVWAENIVRKENKPVLIVTPLAVSSQTLREGKKFGIECKRSIDGKVEGKIIVTNYEKLYLFNPDDFAGVVCDECFSPDTPIDIFNMDNSLTMKYIKDISIGSKIYNAGGIDYVCDIHKRPIDRAIQIGVKGRRFTCSENHLFFTVYGRRFAKDLQAGDCLLATETAVRLVRGDFQTEVCGQQNGEVLRDILLSEMEDVSARDQSQGTQPNCCCQEGEEKIRMVSERKSESFKGVREDCQSKSNVKPKICKEDDSYQNYKWHSKTMERKKGWKWAGVNSSTANSDGNFIRKLADRICNIIREKARRLSDLLQSRYRKPGFEDSDRNRWARACKQEKKGDRQEERPKADFFRVESVEILEPRHPELEKYRDETGVVYFYDIEAKRHPSFSINGFLVHNSSILKNFDGKRKAIITEFLRTRPYRLLCTATAAPNDYIELGTTSEALGELGFMDMLTRFFKNDQDTADYKRRWAASGGGVAKWRFKKHAQVPFWQWVCSWAKALRKPSDMGFDNDGFILPPLVIEETVVSVSRSIRRGLLVQPAFTLKEQRDERRATIKERCEKVAQKVDGDFPAIVWCHLNDEADLLEKIIPGAKQVSGSHSDEKKEERFLAFQDGELRVLITKPRIGAFGLNWQHCSNITFFPSHSFEQFYQGVRRCWRFGQKKSVKVDIITTEGELGVLKNLQRKSEAVDEMFSQLIKLMNNSIGIDYERQFLLEEELPLWG